MVGISSDVPWGKASSELVSAVYDQHVVAIISLDRNSSHLAEQIGVKSLVPVVAVSSDHTLTSINIPWIFRMPEGTTLEQAVQTVSAAERVAGPNRSRIRDELASGQTNGGSTVSDQPESRARPSLRGASQHGRPSSHCTKSRILSSLSGHLQTCMAVPLRSRWPHHAKPSAVADAELPPCRLLRSGRPLTTRCICGRRSWARCAWNSARRLNHWWGIALYVDREWPHHLSHSHSEMSPSRLSSTFIKHKLMIETSRGATREIETRAANGRQVLRRVYGLPSMSWESMSTSIRPRLSFRIPFPSSRTRPTRLTIAEAVAGSGAYCNGAIPYSRNFGRGSSAKRVPVHFFWGSFDLAVTRFSGRPAPPRPGADPVTAEAYSHEVSSAGFWPGGSGVEGPAYYAYAAPEPAGFSQIQSEARARLSIIRNCMSTCSCTTMFARPPRPKKSLMQFLQSTYDAAATSGKWDRKAHWNGSTA